MNLNFNQFFHQNLCYILQKKDKLTYRNNIVYLEKYCISLRFFSGYDNFFQDVEHFLEMFKDTDDINTQKIEENYYKFVSDRYELYNYDMTNYENKSGIYFIYDEFSNIIYIGKSENNLDKRPLQSFICKFPLGAVSIKILPVPKPFVSIWENICIDWFLPILNTQQNNIDFTPKLYAIWLNKILFHLSRLKSIYPTSKKDYSPEIEKEVFDDIEL